MRFGIKFLLFNDFPSYIMWMNEWRVSSSNMSTYVNLTSGQYSTDDQTGKKGE